MISILFLSVHIRESRAVAHATARGATRSRQMLSKHSHSETHLEHELEKRAALILVSLKMGCDSRDHIAPEDKNDVLCRVRSDQTGQVEPSISTNCDRSREFKDIGVSSDLAESSRRQH
jgi:hypothetical protein